MEKGALKVFNKQTGNWEQIPTLKGKDFTYEDFTPEQIKELQKPAQDIADTIDDKIATKANQSDLVQLGSDLKDVILYYNIISGNPEFTPTSLNLETGAFTCPNHTFSVGDNVFLRCKSTSVSETCFPYEFGNTNFTDKLTISSIEGDDIIVACRGVDLTFSNINNIGVDFSFDNFSIEKIVSDISSLKVDVVDYRDVDVVIYGPVINFQNRYNITSGSIEILRKGAYNNNIIIRTAPFEGFSKVTASNAFYKLQMPNSYLIANYRFINDTTSFSSFDFKRYGLNTTCYIPGNRFDKFVLFEENCKGITEFQKKEISFNFTPINGSFVLIKARK